MPIAGRFFQEECGEPAQWDLIPLCMRTCTMPLVFVMAQWYDRVIRLDSTLPGRRPLGGSLQQGEGGMPANPGQPVDDPGDHRYKRAGHLTRRSRRDSLHFQQNRDPSVIRVKRPRERAITCSRVLSDVPRAFLARPEDPSRAPRRAWDRPRGGHAQLVGAGS